MFWRILAVRFHVFQMSVPVMDVQSVLKVLAQGLYVWNLPSLVA